MLEITIKSNKSTKWETLARATAKDGVTLCNTLYEFKNYFENVLKDRKRDSVGHISDSYKVQSGSAFPGAGRDRVFVVHSPAVGKIRVIAEVKLKEVIKDEPDRAIHTGGA